MTEQPPPRPQDPQPRIGDPPATSWHQPAGSHADQLHPGQPQQSPPATPFYRRRWFLPTATGLLGLFIGTGIGSSNTTTETVAGPERTVEVPGPTLTIDRTVTVTVTAPPPRTTPPPKTTPPPPPPPAPATFGEGTFLVPAEVKPGTYTASGAESGNCYWARLKSTSGDFDAIIANGNTGGKATVTIRPTDKAFESSGCTDWTRVG